MRRQLDAAGRVSGKHYELTAALPAMKKVSQYYELKQVAASLDFVDVMAYDFHGACDPTTSFDSPFGFDPADPTPGIDLTTSTAWTVAYYLLRGVPANKIVVGVPFCGKQYIRVNPAKHGLYQPFDNTGLSGDVLTVAGSTTPTYHELVDVAGVVSGNGRVAANGYARLWNRPTGEPWLWSPAAPHTLADGSTVTTPTFISFDDPQSLNERVRLIDGLRLRAPAAPVPLGVAERHVDDRTCRSEESASPRAGHARGSVRPREPAGRGWRHTLPAPRPGVLRRTSR